MIQHFYANNINSLCCQPQKIKSRISSLTDEDWEEIKKLPSIEKYIRQLTNDKNKDELLNNNRFKVRLYTYIFNSYMHSIAIWQNYMYILI